MFPFYVHVCFCSRRTFQALLSLFVLATFVSYVVRFLSFTYSTFLLLSVVYMYIAVLVVCGTSNFNQGTLNFDVHVHVQVNLDVHGRVSIQADALA